MTGDLTAPQDRRQWFVHDRFGMFIHWGLYSLPARQTPAGGNNLAEWVQHNERLTDSDYARYFRHFDPDRFRPADWAREARRAGMRYAVLTSKHHDGFCLWDSQWTDFKATNTPAGRDLVREFVEAFRAEGLRVGLYHSLIDWHHPAFPLDGLHPRRDDPAFRAAEAGRDIRAYRAYLHGQVRELLTDYGRIDLLWFDFSYPDQDWGWSRGKGRDDWDSEALLASVRALQPGILVNNRLDLPDFDFITPEQTQPLAWPEQGGRRVTWEACQTLNGSWGYARDNRDWKSADQLVRLLVDTVSKGGNLLLNVGPNGRGELGQAALSRLREIGAWLELHEHAVRGCTASPWTAPPDTRLTQRGDRLYLHLFAWPLAEVHLPGLADRISYARFVHDASEVPFTARGEVGEHHHLHTPVPAGTLTLALPQTPPEVLVPVIELFLKEGA